VKTSIEINGRQYDAKTGKLIKAQPAVTKPAPKQASHKGWFIDGIKRRGAQHQSVAKAVTPASQPAMQPSTAKVSHISKPPRSSISTQPAARSVEKPQTLLRTIVKKPLPAPGIHSTSAPIVKPGNIIKPTSNHPAMGTIKTHLHSIAQSPSISHFSDVTKNSYAKVVNNLAVVAQKVPEAAPPIFTKKHYPKGEKPQVFNHRVANPQYQTKSHSEHLAKRLSRRLKVKSKAAAVAVSVLAVICLGGFLAYQSIPSLQMRIAARSAGFNGQLPGDIPDGYSFKGPIHYSKEQSTITLEYKSNSDDRQFTIVQKPSTWTSESLLINFLEARDYKKQTSTSSNGLTYYIYNGGNVTWVDDGIWFNVTSDGSLSSDQLISIASSF
jgi:hypothetical protein